MIGQTLWAIRWYEKPSKKQAAPHTQHRYRYYDYVSVGPAWGLPVMLYRVLVPRTYQVFLFVVIPYHSYKIPQLVWLWYIKYISYQVYTTRVPGTVVIP